MATMPDTRRNGRYPKDSQRAHLRDSANSVRDSMDRSWKLLRQQGKVIGFDDGKWR
jgi:hypothetical protein